MRFLLRFKAGKRCQEPFPPGGERGTFYHEAAAFNLSIYLEPDVAAFLQKVAIKKGVEVATVVNDWLRKDMAFIETFIQE
jgi:hypothetical protein